MRSRQFLALFLTAWLGGCAMGPDYTRPAMEAPAKWNEAREKAQPAVALDQTAWWESFGDPLLSELIVQAVKNNLDVKQAKERVVQARATLASTRASLWPSATGTGSVTRSKSSENVIGSGAAPANASGVSTPISSGLLYSTFYDVGFDASWELDVFGGTRRSIESARAKVDADVEDLHNTLLTLLGDVAKYYVELRSYQEQLGITRGNAESQQHSVEVTRERYRLGLTTYLDVAQAEAQKLSTESDIPTIEASVKQSIHRLGILLGKEPNALEAMLSEARPLPKAGGVMSAGIPSELLTRRPDLRKDERKLASASADIGVATADLYPKFDLTLGMGLESLTASKLLALSNGYWSIVPEVSMLLFDAGKTRANIEGKRAVYEESLYAYRYSFLKALEDVENSLTDYYTEQTRCSTLADYVHASEEALALADERYRRGLANFLNVLEAQRTLYSAQSSHRQSEAKVLTSLVSLYKALGGGWNAAELSLAAQVDRQSSAN
ncbi:MAG: efflux transporter outer membrane subunit [Syntrophobacteraceae bacterium]